LLAAEPTSVGVHELFASDPALVVWWGTELECVSAVSRREREGTRGDPALALGRLDALVAHWTEVGPSAQVRRAARRLLRVHALRAADALQLAAGLAAAEAHATSLPFVTSDRRLAAAARREGFPVIEPGS
jgi:uncharacterized protein